MNKLERLERIIDRLAGDNVDLQEKAWEKGFEAGYAAAAEELETGDLRGASFHLKSFPEGDCA